MNCRDRARRSTETPLEKKSRLEKRKAVLANEPMIQTASRLQNSRLYRQQLIKAESEGDRQARLQQMKMNQLHRLLTETEAERGARLEYLKVNQQQRLSTETEAEREARLEHLKVNQQQQINNESLEDREARLNYKKQQRQAETLEESLLRLHRMSTHRRESLECETPEHKSTRLISRDASKHSKLFPMLNDDYVKDRIKKFHDIISSIESPTCSVCQEHFPGIKMTSNSTSCRRCFRDKKIPKLFSAENNMIPGPVPTELQVS